MINWVVGGENYHATERGENNVSLKLYWHLQVKYLWRDIFLFFKKSNLKVFWNYFLVLILTEGLNHRRRCLNQFHEFLRYHRSSVIRKYLINVTKIFNLHLYNKVVEVLLVHALSEVVENQPVGVRGLGDHLVNLELLIMVRSYSKILQNDESSSDSGDKPGHHTIHWNIF